VLDTFCKDYHNKCSKHSGKDGENGVESYTSGPLWKGLSIVAVEKDNCSRKNEDCKNNGDNLPNPNFDNGSRQTLC